MTYPKKLKPEQIEILGPILHRMNNLEPGESFKIKDHTFIIDEFRYLLYSHLYITETKHLFKLIRRGPTELEIKKKINRSPQIIEIEKDSAGVEFVYVKLIEVDSQDEAEKLILDSDLDMMEKSKALDEWRRIMRKT